MSKTTRELSGYAIPRPAAGVMRGALRRRRWEPAGWAEIRRLGTSGLGGARPGEGGQEGGALPLGKTQHGAFPGRQRTGRCPRRCAWHGEGTRAQPVPSHAGLAPQVTLTRKQSPPPQGWPGVEEVAGRGPKRKAGGQEERDDPEGDHGWSGGGWGRAKPPSRAGGRAQAAHTHLPLPLPARPPARRRLRSAVGRARGRARAHTHARALGRPALASAPTASTPRSRSAGSAPAPLIQSQARAPSQPPWPPRSRHGRPVAKSPSQPPAPDPPRSRPTPRPGPASPPRPRPILRLGPASKAELGAVSRLSLPHPAPGLFWPNKGIGCFFDVQAASQWA